MAFPFDTLERLVQLPYETEWVEFKENYFNHNDFGEYISALSNSAAIHGQDWGYLVFGVKNETHEIVGTSTRLKANKVGNEDLEPWAARLLSPRIDFTIAEIEYKGKSVSLVRVQPAVNTPVKFSGVSYIRVGSYKKKLAEFPEKERQIWNRSANTYFESGICETGLNEMDVLDAIDYQSYFALSEKSLPSNVHNIISELTSAKIIIEDGQSGYSVTNLGGILLARRLERFPTIARKAARVIRYKGNNKLETIKERVAAKGYAAGFKGMIEYINDNLPHHEDVGNAIRHVKRVFPEIAIRELAANALIHQDFNATGTSPMIEIFDDRVEFTNYGKPLVSIDRMMDEPPRSRNEAIAGIMKKFGICEERGSGIDKVFAVVEFSQLPAPEIFTTDYHTVVRIWGRRDFSDLGTSERVRACYWHACLKCVSGERMTNETLRERFGVDKKNYSAVSRVIRAAIEGGLIKAHNPNSSSKKHASYVPYWTQAAM